MIAQGFLAGLTLALLAGVGFGASGALAKGLLGEGWTPAAAVTWRVGVAAVALAVPAAWQLRGRWGLLRRGWLSIVLFGVLAVATCQLAYFFAVERLSVAVALLLEYSGVILVVLWLWLRRGHRPQPLTLVGAAVSLTGLALMLDVFGSTAVDPIGVMWALLAAVGLAAYFIISADQSHGLPGLATAGGGLVVGAAVLFIAGASGLVPFRWHVGQVELLDLRLPWWSVVGALALFSTALAYSVGIAAARRLGPKLASFIAFSEVGFAVLWAWVLLDELPAAIQLVGGLLLVAGIVLVRLDEMRWERAAATAVRERRARAADARVDSDSTDL